MRIWLYCEHCEECCKVPVADEFTRDALVDVFATAHVGHCSEDEDVIVSDDLSQSISVH